MGELFLGVLNGYSGGANEHITEYGKFNIYFKYDNIYRDNSGNSTTVRFNNCYIYAEPYYTNRYTTNYIYIDSVQIYCYPYGSDGWVDMGISGSWNGKQDETHAQGYTSSTSTKDLTFNIGHGETAVRMYGHRSGTYENSQCLSGTVYFESGWSHVSYPYANGVKNGEVIDIINSSNYRDYVGDNGDNSITIVMTDWTWSDISDGTNNAFTRCGLNYKFKDTQSNAYIPWQQCDDVLESGDRKPYWKRYIPPNSKYLHFQDVFAQGVDFNGVTRTNWGAINGQLVKHYSKPGAPKNLKITSRSINTDQSNVSISAEKGSDGENNAAKGVKIEYSIKKQDQEQKWNAYSGEFTVNRADLQNIAVRAWTYGTEDREVYVDNSLQSKHQIYYSDEVVAYSNTQISIQPPGSPDTDSLKITDNGNNTFSIQCDKGDDGTNNPAIGIEIYYTLDGTSPLNNNDIKSPAIKYNGGSVLISKDTTVNVVARTVGAHPQYKYSTWISSNDNKVYFYKTPDISTPIITTTDKKLTKKSIINVKQQLTLYKNTQIKSCKINLHRVRGDIDECISNGDEYNYEWNETDYINRQLVESDVIYTVDCNYNLRNFDLKKDDEIYVVISYTITNGAGNNLAQNLSTSQKHQILSNGVMRVNVDGTWHEGQVWIYNNGWKEATDVFVRTNGGWKESI